MTGMGKNWHWVPTENCPFDQMRLKARDLDVSVDGQKLRLSGGMDLTDLENPRVEKLQAETDGIDLAALPLDLPVSGTIQGSMALDGTKDNLTGSGTFTSPVLTFQGYEAAQVTLPFSFRGPPGWKPMGPKRPWAAAR